MAACIDLARQHSKHVFKGLSPPSALCFDWKWFSMYTFKFASGCLRGLFIILVLTSVIACQRYEEEDEIPGKNVDLIPFMKNMTNTFCTCGRTVLQSRFCTNDFVIVGRKFGQVTRFYDDPEYEGMRYSGLIIPISVQQVFRGSMKVNSIVNLHYILGSQCGVDRSSVPEDDQPFLITGFQNKFLKRKKKGDKSVSLGEEGKELFLVTSCGDSIKLTTLTHTQIAGVFLNYYCNGMATKMPKVYVTQDAPSDVTTCYFHFSKAQCYDKYSICFSNGGVARWRAIRRIIAVPPILASIPVELHKIVKSNPGITDEDLFQYCLFYINLTPPKIPAYY